MLWDQSRSNAPVPLRCPLLLLLCISDIFNWVFSDLSGLHIVPAIWIILSVRLVKHRSYHKGYFFRKTRYSRSSAPISFNVLWHHVQQHQSHIISFSTHLHLSSLVQIHRSRSNAPSHHYFRGYFLLMERLISAIVHYASTSVSFRRTVTSLLPKTLLIKGKNWSLW